MKAYSQDLRRKIVAAYENNDYSQSQVAQLFSVSATTVRNLVRRKRETGDVDALPQTGGKNPTLGEQERQSVRQMIKDNADATLSELCNGVEREHKKRVSTSTMCRLLQLLELPRKKRRFMPLRETPQESNKRGRTGGK
jgi:transposase